MFGLRTLLIRLNTPMPTYLRRANTRRHRARAARAQHAAALRQYRATIAAQDAALAEIVRDYRAQQGR